MTISSSHHDATGFLGDTLMLECSVEIEIRSDSPQPTFQWFFGSAHSSLPSGVTVSSVRNNSSTYISTLNISSLQESHSGMYTCQLSDNTKLATNTFVNVLSKLLSVSVNIISIIKLPPLMLVIVVSRKLVITTPSSAVLPKLGIILTSAIVGLRIMANLNHL